MVSGVYDNKRPENAYNRQNYGQEDGGEKCQSIRIGKANNPF